jgi:hypothetical protein
VPGALPQPQRHDPRGQGRLGRPCAERPQGQRQL